jgi:serine/threonine-protein kinase
LEQSQTVERGIGTMLYLAECYEKLGRTASAWALFREAASEARAGGQAARAEAGAARAQALEPKLSRLSVQVPAENLIAGFELFRDGEPIGKALYGIAVPVDPGEHKLEARAPGRLSWTGTQHVGADGASATISVPVLEIDPNAAVPAATAASGPAPGAAASSAPDGDLQRASTQRTVGLVTGGAGVVALGLGGFFGLRAMSKNDDALEHCSGGTCRDQKGVDLTNDAQNAANLANVLVVGGTLLTVTGVVLYLTAPAPGAPTAAISSDGHGVRLNVGGAF